MAMDYGCTVDGTLVDIEGELSEFRRQWQDELRTRTSVLHSGGSNEQQQQQLHEKAEAEDDDCGEQPSTEEQATYLYQQGVNAELNGQLYVAIRYYRRAVQLVPDIELRMHNVCVPESSYSKTDPTNICEADEVEDDEDSLDDLVQHFSKIVANDGAICQAEFESMVAGHISCLPVELLMYLFKWVVSSHLDTISLEQLSQVCRGFYLCARDEEVWKLICQRIWGLHTGSVKGYGSYRRMYLLRPHLRYNGVYIAKTSYYRPGEKGLDNYYRPYHIVDYYRYVHFFADGHVLMFTSPDDPVTVLPRIRSQTARVQGLLYGVYRLTGDQVAAVLKRQKTTESNYSMYRYRRSHREVPPNEDTFHMEFLMQRSGRRPYAKLVWDHYSNHSVSRSTGQESTTEFDLNKKSFPPLIFCRVKSYTATSQQPLQ